MAQALETPETAYTAPGGLDTFATVWTFERKEDVEVLVEVDGAYALQEQDEAYVVTPGDWRADGANIVFQTGHVPAEDAGVILRRNTAARQDEAFGDTQRFRPEHNERAFDRLTRMLQETKAAVARAVRWPFGETGEDIPPLSMRKGKLLGFDPVTGMFALTAPETVSITYAPVPTLIAAAALSFSLATAFVQTSGYYSVGDGGDALYMRVVGEPAHGGKFQDASGTWWALAEITPNLKQFGAFGNGLTDDSAAFDRAASYRGKIIVPEKEFRASWSDFNAPDDMATIRSGCEFIGTRGLSVIRPHDPDLRAAIGCDSGGAATFVTGIKFQGITFQGWLVEEGHFEYGHLVNISGGVRVRFEDCDFLAARGDGVCMASGAGGPTHERHNHDVQFVNCLFDGLVDGEDRGRNGASIIDGNIVRFTRCHFRRLSRNDMPGAICLEPDQAFGVMARVYIDRCVFEDNKGNRGHIAVSLDNIAAWRTIKITNCSFDGGTALSVYSQTGLPTRPHDLVFHDNDLNECDWIVNAVGGSLWGFDITKNRSYATGANKGRLNIGNGSADFTTKRLAVNDNVFVGNSAIIVGITNNTPDVEFKRNRISGGTQAHCRFGTTGTTTSYWRVNDNHFIGSPSNGWIQHDASSHSPFTHQFYRNSGDGPSQTHAFRAVATDHPGVANMIVEATRPDAIPVGLECRARCAHQNFLTGDDNGEWRAYRGSAAEIKSAKRWFIPDHTGDEAPKIYIQKALDEATWSDFYEVIGVAA